MTNHSGELARARRDGAKSDLIEAARAYAEAKNSGLAIDDGAVAEAEQDLKKAALAFDAAVNDAALSAYDNARRGAQ